MKKQYKKGTKFNKVSIIKELEQIGSIRLFECRCDCGRITKVRFGNLKNNHTMSCGCHRVFMNKTHGMSNTKENKIWSSLKDRCLNKRNKRYSSYGGRGITLCEKWLKFEGFFEDMGYKPDEKSLDRIDNDKGYCKKNCRWATPIEQQNNMRNNIYIRFDNRVESLTYWSNFLGIQRNTLTTRLRRGWSVNRTLTTK